MKALIVGIDSTLGAALCKTLQAHHWEVHGTTRKKELVSQHVHYLDLASVDIFTPPIQFDVIYLCAALTNIAQCEKNPEESKRMNMDAPIQLALKFPSAHIVFLSTCAVFDGTTPHVPIHATTCPTTVYGTHKAEAEKTLLTLTNNITIVRLTKVLTPVYPLILGWIQALTRGEEITPFNFMYVCPIAIHHVTHCLRHIGEKKSAEIIHLSGETDVSYFELARTLASLLNLNKALITPQCMIESANLAKQVPRFASLDIAESKKLFALDDLSIEATLRGLFTAYMTMEGARC